MKERIISAIIALLITVPLFLLGGIYFKVLVVILSLLGLRELMNAKDKIPKYMKYISYILLLLLMISSFELINVDFYLDLKLVILVMILTILPVLIYSDNEVYNVVDAFYLISSILFLYIAFNLFIIVRDENIMLAIYLLIVPMITDIFAYFGGIKFGRYKLTKSFSPNKSVEGVIIGTVFSTILASLFYYFCVNVDTSIILIIVMSLFLSIIGQFGDLFFSSIKRYFKIKDFSNIMPGHGGILDRCDSMIFVLLGYVFIIGIL